MLSSLLNSGLNSLFETKCTHGNVAVDKIYSVKQVGDMLMYILVN